MRFQRIKELVDAGKIKDITNTPEGQAKLDVLEGLEVSRTNTIVLEIVDAHFMGRSPHIFTIEREY
tara:strand:+ start:363 stop:560 length:198 start_codon:yes stop_codon:yes gene_type:complete